MTKYYVDKSDPDKGYYEIHEVPGKGFRWFYLEVALGVPYPGQGPFWDTEAEAYTDAADDWEDNGNSSNKRLSGHLRAAATRANKKANK